MTRLVSEAFYPGLPFALFCVAACCGMAVGQQRGATETQLRVVKRGDSLFIRSAFSPQEDLVVRVGKGSNGQVNFSNAGLIAASAGMGEKDLSGGRLIHGCGDDSTPWNINGTYIGANHGCSDVREVTCNNHGRKPADLGSEWEDDAGAKFYLIKILDANRLWFLPRNTGKGDLWQFRTTISGASLKSKARGAALTFSDNPMAQLRPACRIKKQEYLVNGKTPLKDGEPVSCDRLEVVEEYGIINPASLLDDIVGHPGQERDFAADHLAAVIHNHIVYRFHPNGATVIYYTAKALQEFRIGYMGFIRSAKLAKGNYDTHEYYIPKTLPFTQDGLAYDFKAIKDYSSALPSPLRFTAAIKNVADPENLPDRFIQFLGRKEAGRTVREVGYALGYSLIHGLTKPSERAKNASSAIMLYTSSKSYPVAVDSKMGATIPTGTEFYCVAYRQYFHLAAQKNATSLYWHEQDGDTVVYADYHKPVERDVLRLPAELTGKAITLIEKTPSLTLHTDKAVPASGVVVSVAGRYGHIVFKVR